MYTSEQLLDLKPGDRFWFAQYFYNDPGNNIPTYNKKPMEVEVTAIHPVTHHPGYPGLRRNHFVVFRKFSPTAPDNRTHRQEYNLSINDDGSIRFRATAAATEAEAWQDYSRFVAESAQEIRDWLIQFEQETEQRIQKTENLAQLAQQKALTKLRHR